MRKRILPFLALAIAVSYFVLSQTQPAPTTTSASAATKSQNEVVKLELGQPIERELAGGQFHSYQLTLSADQFLRVVVEQRGIDVVVRILDPNGKELIEGDSPNGALGTEPVSVITKSSGRYRLEVSSLEKSAPAGRYEIRVLEFRPATPQDRELTDAAKRYSEAVKLRGEEKFDKALPLARRVVEIRERMLGADHQDVAATLYLLGSLYHDKEEITQAEPLYQRALKIYEESLGSDHSDIVAVLDSLALLYHDKGDYANAEPLYRRALTIRETKLGPEHLDVAQSFNNFAEMYRDKGDYVKAEELCQRALTIREKKLGLEHLDVATSLNNLAVLYHDNGDYAKAEPLYQRALVIREKKLGPEHPDVAQSLNDLAELYLAKEDYAKAEPFYQRALMIREKKLGPEHPDVAYSLNGLAELYRAKGNDSGAEPLYRRALAIREKALGPQHPDVAATLDGLGWLHQNKMEYDRAEPLHLRALEIYEGSLGAGHLYVATSLDNLATLYRAKKDFGRAEPLYQRALTIREMKLGPDHLNVAQSLSGIAGLYHDKGEYAKAEPLYQRALAIREKKLGSEHPDVATSLNDLAELYRFEGADSKAEPLYRRTLAIREKTLGPHHPDVAETLNGIGCLYQNKMEYDQAEPLHWRALEIYEKARGPEHLDVATSLDNLAALYQARSELGQAESLYQRALMIREKQLGAEHLDVAQSLISLALLYQAKGDYAKEEPLYQRALMIHEKKLGTEHPDVAALLFDLSLLYQGKGESAKAKSLLQRAQDIYEKALGPKDHDDANSLASVGYLAGIYLAKGEYAKAEEMLQRALAIRVKAHGLEHLDVAQSRDDLATLYQTRLDFKQAEVFFQGALVIREKILGREHLDVAKSLLNLGRIYLIEENYVEAEQRLQLALSIQKKVIPLFKVDSRAIAIGSPNRPARIFQSHPDIAASLHSLGILYSKMGDGEKAGQCFHDSLSILENLLGTDHPEIATTLVDFAQLYLHAKNYAEAESLLRRSLAIQERAFGSESLSALRPLCLLASLYIQRADYAKAELLLQRAQTIAEKALGSEHFQVGSTLAFLYQAKNDYTNAEPVLRRTLAIVEKEFGPEHRAVSALLDRLSILNLQTGNLKQAIAFLTRSNEIRERHIRRNVGVGSERQKLDFLATFRLPTYYSVSLHVQYAPNDLQALRLALTTILRYKGRGLDAMTDIIAQLRRRADVRDKALLEELSKARSMWANTSILGPSVEDAPRSHWKRAAPLSLGGRGSGKDNPIVYKWGYERRVKDIEEYVEKLEAELGTRLKEFQAQSQPITLDTVQTAIPNEAALVEFASYQPIDARNQTLGPRRYIAYVLARQGEPRWVDLGEAAPIDQAVNAVRESLRDPEKANVGKIARALDEKVMRPVRALLGETRRVFISPDGALNLIPFASLVDEQNRYLVERFSFSYLTSGRDLLRLQVKAPGKQAPLVVANPDFGTKDEAGAGRLLQQQPKEQPKGSSAAHAFSQFSFPPLPYTAEEGEAVQKLLPSATLLAKRQATKTALKQVASPALLHIATHGFFLEDLPVAPPNTRGLQMLGFEPDRLLLQQAAIAGMRIENPLLRSGLALAGANEQRQEDDGILTALEVAGLDLWGTKLVALSACDTGVGEVKNGEGVYGLRRALVLAGAETQVMSLWPVSDRGTRDLMIEYYTALLAGQGRSEAMRQVQLQMLSNPQRQHPYYWAGFIVSGEWANLDGKR